ncbi:MAG: hypothetical protein JNK74_13175 [Candidatus Hydrogenedentes bacterium]|nr:hypothetical protein [Candidatus Hydrogenedentota bacterium]
MLLSNRGNMGMRIIVFMGAATFLFLMLMAFGLKKSLQPQAGARVPEGAATSPFQEDRAWADVEALRALGSDEKLRRDFVSKSLRTAGLKTRRITLGTPGTAAAPPESALVGIVEGNRPGVLLLGTVLNAPPGGDTTTAADAAWLLEMTRILGNQRDGRSIWAVFLESSGGAATTEPPSPPQAGAQLVEALRASGELDEIDAVVMVQGIGDCTLAVVKEAGAPPVLTEILWNTAAREGYKTFFGKLPARVQGNHLAFREAGIPALSLFDVRPGSRERRESSENAEAPGDTCRESLRAVGDVIYHALAPLEGHLDETGMRNDGH